MSEGGARWRRLPDLFLPILERDVIPPSHSPPFAPSLGELVHVIILCRPVTKEMRMPAKALLRCVSGFGVTGFVLVALDRVRALELTQKPPLAEVRAVLFWSRLLETLGGHFRGE